ncbi:MAG: hypothetical protein IPL34_20305 [Thiofilum sp.]|uniref:hypothetical protein n=1 Tax=Thiofilum sp. TaxID=2212733 RepID=UPI0025DB2358|nr:hypothetical protein [Thiofilum sp.]MBK8455625.1 hypothetical protein [Thiofilum sp.]
MITKQELENLKEVAGKYSKCLNLPSEEVTPSSWFNITQSKFEFREEANPDTVLRIIEALEVATKSLIKIRVNCSCTELCMCSEDDVFIAQEALNKIYGSIE